MHVVKKLSAAVLAVLLLLTLLPSCAQDGSDAKYDELTGRASQESTPAETSSSAGDEEELSGRLTIMADMEFEWAGVAVQARRFQEAHPGVEIEIEYGLSASDESGSSEAYYAKIDQYLQRIATRVMGGDPPDLLVSGIYPVEKYTASGLLVDLYQLMEEEGMDRSRFYENILQLYEHDGGLYVMPGSFTVSAAVLNRTILAAAGVEEPETVDWEFLLDTYLAARDSGEVPTLKSLDVGQVMGKNLLDAWEYPLYMDFKGQSASFTSPEFVSYLEKTARNDTPVTVLDGFSNATVGGSLEDEFARPNDSLAVITDLSPARVEWLDISGENVTNLIPITNSRGQVCAVSSECMAIPVGSENRELAWEFIKFCTDGADGFPIDREACHRVLREEYACSDEAIEKAEAFIEKAGAKTLGDQKFMGIIREDLGDYYDRGLLSAEECARKLQERAEIYLKE